MLVIKILNVVLDSPGFKSGLCTSNFYSVFDVYSFLSYL
jgi:hypothetical protein